MRKRIVSIALALCMVLALMPQTAFAAESFVAGAGKPYTFKDGTPGAGKNEGPSSLIDGNSSTKWCVTNFKSAYIIFSTDSPVNVSGYNITTGNDNAAYHGRNPKNWTLYGCNDSSAGRNSTSWMPIHSVMNDTILQDENNTTYNFAFDNNETEYQYYKLEITAIQNGDVMQMSEFALTDCDHSWGPSASVAPTCTTSGYTTRTCSVCGGTDYIYLKPVDHNFTGENGKCIYCNYTSDVLHQGYVDENGISRKLNDNTTEITASSDELSSGWYIVRETVNVNSITVSGNVHLILADGCNLTVTGDIKGGSLTIYGQSGGTGSLTVGGSITSGNGGNAYSNTNNGGNGGNITINGGIVKAGSITSGIGGNGNSSGGSYGIGSNGGNGGKITINGGVIEAGSITSGSGGAGGPGYEGGGVGGNGGSVTLNGGMVKAGNITSGNGGNGGNCSGYSKGNGGNGGNGGEITINGGIVEGTSITSGSGGNGGSGGSNGSNGSNGSAGSIVLNTGIVFQGDSGQVYGGDVTLSESFAIPAGKTLTIDSEKTLTIPTGKTLTVNGTLTNNGKIYVDGTLSGTASVNGDVYYHLALTNCTTNSTIGMEAHDEKTYGKAGSEVTLTPDTPPTGYKFSKWNFTPAVTISETNTFTMPSAAITVTAQFGPDTYNIAYELNGGTINSGDITSYAYGQGATLPTDVTKAGYAFKGWYENESFTGNPVTEIGTTDTGVKKYWAKWMRKGSYPISQKPAIEGGEGAQITLSTDGTAATITVDDGYGIADVMLNGVSLGKVTEVKNLKTGDKLVVTVEKKEAEPTQEEILAALAEQQLSARSKLVTMKNGKKAIKITWYNQNGETMDFDGVEIYRSAKRNSGYGNKPFYATKGSDTKGYYTNTKDVKIGTTYYYKVRGYVIIDGNKHYTDYSLKAIRTVK